MGREGTPDSAALQLGDRLRRVEHTAGEAARQKSEREYGGVQVGYAVDPNDKGPGLRLEFTVEDPKTFVTPWTGVVTYRRNIGPWPERVCAENVHNYGAMADPNLPTANHPDF